MHPKRTSIRINIFNTLRMMMARGGVDTGAASVRMLLATGVLIYLLVTDRNDNYLLGEDNTIVYLAIFYFSYASLQWLLTLFWPGPNFIRRAISILADSGVVTYALIIAGETATPFYGGYLWVTIANGLRYGRNYLIVTNIFCIIGFGTVLLVSTYWQSQMVLGIGLLVWLILLPGYVAALLKRLEDALRKAKQASQTKSDFLANMSHELRTPLNAIIGYSEMLEEDAMAEGNKQAASDLNKIQHSANHLLGLINGILDLSKVESGKTSIMYEWFDIRNFFEEILTGMHLLLDKRGNLCSLEFNLDRNEVYTDKLKLKQVVINLLGNANKFTEAGRIHITVNNFYRKNHSELEIVIRDTGIGIAQDKLPFIFDPFVQADTSTTRRYEGSGLGLTITRRFVEILGGTVKASSEYGQGSIFSVNIPLTKEACEDQGQQVIALAAVRKIAS